MRVLLSNKIHHGHLCWHGHGCTHTAWLLLHHALHRVVCHLWELLWAWSTSARQGKNCLVHSSDRSTHDVGLGCVWTVCWSAITACHARVGFVDIASMCAAVVLIFPTLVGCGRFCRLLGTGTVAIKPGWLLREVVCTVCTASATVAPI